MIKIRRFTPTQIKLFDSDNQFIGFINNKQEFKQVKEDIINEGLTNYYCTFGNIKFDIKANTLPKGINWFD